MNLPQLVDTLLNAAWVGLLIYGLICVVVLFVAIKRAPFMDDEGNISDPPPTE